MYEFTYRISCDEKIRNCETLTKSMDEILKYRTDMAVEAADGRIKSTVKIIRNVTRTDVVITPDMTAYTGKDAGRYITLDAAADFDIGAVAQCIADALKNLVPDYKSALVVGLGNADMTADALGPLAVKKIIVTRHIYDEMKEGYGAGMVSAFCPNVLGVTGIESYDIIKGVAERVKPDVVICIDSLAGRSSERIGTSFQITDTGISPGSGLGFRKFKLNSESLNANVIAIGVPLVVFARTIAMDAVSRFNPPGKELEDTIRAVTGNLVVTPKEIDILVDRCAYTLAFGINKFLHQKMNDSEIKELQFNS